MTSEYGTLEIHDGVKVLRYERRLRHPVDRVWRALTEPAELRGWLADADLDPAPGGRVELRWLNTDDEGNRAVARGTVARWELEPEGDGATRLTLTVEHGTLPDEYVTKVRAGWHIHLEHLEAALDGEPVDWERWNEEHLPRWKEIEARYSAQQTIA